LTREAHDAPINAVLDETRAWIENVVVGLGLCPFAQASITEGGLKMVHCDATDPKELASVLRDALLELRTDAGKAFDGYLVVHPNVLTEFESFNDFLDDADEILEASPRSGEFQIASFHPDYRFAGTQPDDVGNYTNRSPYPMLHILREASVERALANFGDPAQIPERNVEQLESLGLDAVKKLLASCKRRD
jgi:hypothetical protein